MASFNDLRKKYRQHKIFPRCCLSFCEANLLPRKHIFRNSLGGFKQFVCSSLFGEMIKFDYFFGLLKPPTSCLFGGMFFINLSHDNVILAGASLEGSDPRSNSPRFPISTSYGIALEKKTVHPWK